MTLYIFRCRTRPKKYGASRYETGSNLPTDRSSGLWQFYERVDLGPRGKVSFDVDTTTLLNHVRRFGFYVWDESPKELRRSAAVENKPPQQQEPPTPVQPETPSSEVVVPPSIKPAPLPPPAARHQVVWFDIPVRDLDRALHFYSAVLGAKLKKEQAGPGVSMAMLPQSDGFVSGCLLQNADARPSDSGPLLYLNTHGRLEEALHAVEKYGGRVLSARHSIAPFGFRAIVLDSEGNRLALHSND